MIDRCCLPRLVKIGGREFRLSPPSVGEALQILGALKHQQDHSDVELLLDLVSGLQWKPDVRSMRPVLKGMLFQNPLGTIQWIQSILFQGYEPKKIANDLQGKSDSPNWGNMIELYRDVYGGSRWEVFNEVPFPFFLESMKQLGIDRARKNINMAVIHNPSKKTVEKWRQDVNGGVKEYGPVISATPEEIQRAKELEKNRKKIGR